ncbi:glucose-dependent insulinotropic receptor [Osmerus mordax]|uniref:glucose-dependent insulinotropic receptor n=1 Tax=Osmerus mordax TaxID=8014 RepID=UPI00351095A3
MAPYNTSSWRRDPSINLSTFLHPAVRPWDLGLKPHVTGWILSVAACLIISTNLLVAAALLQLIRRRGSQSWYFVLNLALADTLVGLAITGVASDDFSYNAAAEPSGYRVDAGSSGAPSARKCLFRMAFIIAPSTASILSMFLISLDRYMAIKLPLRYSRLTGKWTVAGSLVVLWVMSLTIAILPGVVKGLQQESYGGFCTFFSVIRPGGIMLIFCTVFFPILSVFLFFYLDILKIACFHQKQIRQARQAGSRLPQGSYRYWGHVKALRTVALLVGCFTMSWCPFFVVCAVQFLCEDCKLLRFLENDLWLLGLSNSLINPLVYACWQREVRLQLGSFFCKSSRLLLHTGASDASDRFHTQGHLPTQMTITGSEPMEHTFLPHLPHQETHTMPLSVSTSM